MLDVFWIMFETNYYDRHLRNRSLKETDFLHEIGLLQTRLTNDFMKLFGINTTTHKNDHCSGIDIKTAYVHANNCLNSMGVGWCNGDPSKLMKCGLFSNIVKKIDGDLDFISLMNFVEDLVEIEYYQHKFVMFMKNAHNRKHDVYDDYNNDDDIPF
jgi:hypothetical protein